MLVTRCTRGTALALSTVRKTQRWNKEIGNDAGTVVRETGILDSDGNALRTVLLDPAAQPRSLCARCYSSRASLLIPPLIPRAPGGHRAPQPRPVAPPTVCGAHLHRSPARRRPDSSWNESAEAISLRGWGDRSPESSRQRPGRRER